MAPHTIDDLLRHLAHTGIVEVPLPARESAGRDPALSPSHRRTMLAERPTR